MLVTDFMRKRRLFSCAYRSKNLQTVHETGVFYTLPQKKCNFLKVVFPLGKIVDQWSCGKTIPGKMDSEKLRFF